MLENIKNYFPYQKMIQNGETSTVINIDHDISIETISDHRIAIENILRDGIETPYVQSLRFVLVWDIGASCALSIVDWWYNTFMWSMILYTDQKIEPKHIFYDTELKRNNIKAYIDKFIIPKKTEIPVNDLSSIICDGLWHFSDIEAFALYLANTINNEDNIDLASRCPEFNDLIHCDLSTVPFDQVKEVGMQYTNSAIRYIKDSKHYIGYDHGLANSFRASEAINPRQYKEAALNIGTKPDGNGQIYPTVINQSFMNGGVNDPVYYAIESNAARTAQIYSKNNVGESGELARYLKLNNVDTFLFRDDRYFCDTKHFIKYTIKSEKHLSRVRDRFYRTDPNGFDDIIRGDEFHLIGQTIYLYSPMTCASNAHGYGICRRCYGNVYYTNSNINVGVIAAEQLSAQLTQILLSAKHLLETKIKRMRWNPEFEYMFTTEVNRIALNEDYFIDEDVKRYSLVINLDDIVLSNDEEDTVVISDDGETVEVEGIENYNEYITSFFIKTPSGEHIKFGTEDKDELYISSLLNAAIRKRIGDDSKIIEIPLSALMSLNSLFYTKINNNEISKTMNDIINIINKNDVTSALDIHQALQKLSDLTIDGSLSIDSVHLEVILSNQIIDVNNIIKKPNWSNAVANHRLVTLNQALANNPSVIISLLYKDLSRVLYNPLTFTKSSPTVYDKFFMVTPQNYMYQDLLSEEKQDTSDTTLLMAEFIDGSDKEATDDNN